MVNFVGDNMSQKEEENISAGEEKGKLRSGNNSISFSTFYLHLPGPWLEYRR